MEYAVAKNWLFSSSGALVNPAPVKYRLIAPTFSGQYREGAL